MLKLPVTGKTELNECQMGAYSQKEHKYLRLLNVPVFDAPTRYVREPSTTAAKTNGSTHRGATRICE
jgi:hypothetical protein